MHLSQCNHLKTTPPYHAIHGKIVVHETGP